MPHTALHQCSHWLLRFAQRHSPPEAREWGDAMIGELEAVEGSWQRVAWSAGATGVLMKESVRHSLFIRRSAGSEPAPRLFLPGGPMRKIPLWLGLIAVLTFVALLLAPSFRQALDVSVNCWTSAFEPPGMPEGQWRALAERAHREHDAEMLAFLAIQPPLRPDSRRVAEEAVQLNPKLTWVYFVLANRVGSGPEAEAWIHRLEAWDPTNAAPYLLEAGQIAFSRGELDPANMGWLEADPRWLQAMESAFAATKYDPYLAMRLDLERAMMRRRGSQSPFRILAAMNSHPLPQIDMMRRYAGRLLRLGQEQEAAGRLDQAAQTYWTVAKFGRLLNSQSYWGIEQSNGAWIQLEACERLQALAGKQGNREMRDLLAFQSEQLRQLQMRQPRTLDWMTLLSWNAAVGQAASLALMIFGTVLLAAGVLWLLGRRRRTATPTGMRRAIQAGGALSAAGFVLSSLALYLSYRPFAEIFARFAQSSGTADLESLWAFWDLAEVPFTLRDLYSPEFLKSYFLLGVAGTILLVELARILGSRLKTSTAS